MASYAVAVTGGSGFLGQHVIKHLQLHATWITEIRVFDIIPFIQKLDYEKRLQVKSVCGSLDDLDILRKTFNNVSAVLHVASLIDTRFQPDKDALHKVNVQGTANVIEACIAESVENVIYCSSISSIQGYFNCHGGSEADLQDVSPLLFKDYGNSKRTAENMVLKTNGTVLPNGKLMKTVSLIPPTMYGEGDKLVVSVLQMVAANNGMFVRIGNGQNKEIYSYVGNVAWGFVCCLKAMKNKADVGNERFFIVDDTPPRSIQHLLKPFLDCHGFRTSYFYVPVILVCFILAIIQGFCLLISPFKKISFSLSLSSQIYLLRDFYIKYDKAKKFLNYSPLYSYDQAIEVSKTFYKNI